MTPEIKRVGSFAALGTLVGIALSGPLTVALVALLRPQPAWTGVRSFVEHFHAIQVVPYPGGIVLVLGLILLSASLAAMARPEQLPRVILGLVVCGVFATMIFLNYVIQTAFIPVLVAANDPASEGLLAALSMANPKSLSWAIEMWGWGFFGVTTWCLSAVFAGGGVERSARYAFALNGPVSILGAFWTVLQPGWVMTKLGLAMFAGWNVLLAVMAVPALRVFRASAASSLPADRARGT